MAGVHNMLLSMPRASSTAQVDPLVVEPVWLQRGSSSGNVRTFSGVDIGVAHPNRSFILRAFSRTNTTTGARRLTGATITIDGTPYVGEILAESSATAVSSPCALWQIAAPTGVVGDITITISGNTDGVAAEHYQLYSVRGNYAVLEAAHTETTSISVASESGGVAIHGVYTAATTMTTGDYTVQDDTFNNGAISVLAGRVSPTMSPTTTVTASAATRSLLVTLGQR
jgi:hypothetical protein